MTAPLAADFSRLNSGNASAGADSEHKLKAVAARSERFMAAFWLAAASNLQTPCRLTCIDLGIARTRSDSAFGVGRQRIPLPLALL